MPVKNLNWVDFALAGGGTLLTFLAALVVSGFRSHIKGVGKTCDEKIASLEDVVLDHRAEFKEQKKLDREERKETNEALKNLAEMHSDSIHRDEFQAGIKDINAKIDTKADK